jgi:hypothetical protein
VVRCATPGSDARVHVRWGQDEVRVCRTGSLLRPAVMEEPTGRQPTAVGLAGASGSADGNDLRRLGVRARARVRVRARARVRVRVGVRVGVRVRVRVRVRLA